MSVVSHTLVRLDRSNPEAHAHDAADEVLHASDRTRVVRRHMPDGRGSVVLKQLLGLGAARRMRHEVAMLDRLAAVQGVPKLAKAMTLPDTVVLRDDHAEALSHRLDKQGFDMAELLAFALELTEVIARVHQAGVLHRDINPSNIALAGPQRRAMLIDFNLASTFAEQPGFVHHREIVGTLAYLAPEQTGRTGRPVDRRADLYAWGATLYELATGRLPFAADDPLQLIHDQLARMPAPPSELNAGLPQGLSDIVMRLLEKEPDRRYQSAEGLAHDLQRLRERLACGDASPLALGERDFALRLTPPSRLIGRDSEIRTLHGTFEAAVQDCVRGLWIAGAPGVGKTALIGELRPMVTARCGWYVSGKSNQYGHDTLGGAVLQALRGLGRLLLAEPDAELAVQCERLAGSLGPNAGLLTSVLPEFATLLGPQAGSPPSDPLETEVRLRQGALDLLRAVVSPARPLVLVLDDLQWAGRSETAFIDAVLTATDLRGLLLVGIYREDEVDAAHPLDAALQRWAQLDTAPTHVRLLGLAPTDLTQLVREMLHLPQADAAPLADLLAERTAGNPYDTVELINALRRDGALALEGPCWRWDAQAIRRFVGEGDVVDLLAARIASLPSGSRQLLRSMAVLGGELTLGMLELACDVPAAELEQCLQPALEDGLLVLDRAGRSDADCPLRFRHDRVQQAAREGLDAGTRDSLQLAIARRLSARPEFAFKAAEQYLAVASLLRDRHEQARAIQLFRDAARQAGLTGKHAAAEHFLATALRLLQGGVSPPDAALVRALHTAHHAALYALGRLAEADAVYASIQALSDDPLALAEATSVQISSLCHRSRQRDAVTLGLSLLDRLGLRMPQEDLAAAVDAQLDRMCHWVAQDPRVDDLRSPHDDDVRVRLAARLMNRMLPAALSCNPMIGAWLTLQSQRLWAEHGPNAALVATLGGSSNLMITLRDDHRTGYLAARRAVATGEHRAWEVDTAQARFAFAAFGVHWFEPLEQGLRQVQLAREGLLRGGDLQFAALSYNASVAALCDCAPTLDGCAEEVEAALGFAARTGNDYLSACMLPSRQWLRALRGQTGAAGSLNDASFDEAAHLAHVATKPVAAMLFHVNRAMVAAVFDDTSALQRHAAAALPLLPHARGFYRAALVQLMQGLALAQRVAGSEPEQRTAVLAELDQTRGWLARRAVDAPGNFLHLSRLLDAERARAVGDLPGALRAYDAALCDAASISRPWHRALIAERAGRFHLEQGLEHTGRDLLLQARRLYDAWGASAKVCDLDRRHPGLCGDSGSRSATPASRRSSGVSADAMDLLGILRASQVLSSETRLDRLQSRVIELLGEMTGATAVQIALRNDETDAWFLSAQGQDAGLSTPVQVAADQGLLPLSVLRFAQRTREPLLVPDALGDDRFARDPYFATLEHVSLLAVPVLGQEGLNAVVLLENRLGRGAFSTHRLDAVMLIAGQLTVSLQNARLYASLERKVAERTEALEAAKRRLEALSITDPLTGLANRRRFAEVLEAEWKRALRPRSSLGVAMIDIDHFKLYNDHYGHLAGDECLRRVAASLSASLREGTDLVARYGGEEFVMVLPSADPAAAWQVAERARAAVAALQEPHETASHGIVTVSIGVASTVPSAQGDAQQFLGVADAALYASKRNGRNQVTGAPI